MKKTTLKKLISAAIITGAVAALGTAMAISSSAEDVLQDEVGFTPFCGAMMFDDASETGVSAIEASAEPESTIECGDPVDTNKSEEEKNNVINPDELSKEDKSEETKMAETFSRALYPIKEKTGIDDNTIDRSLEELMGDKYGEDYKTFAKEYVKTLYNTAEGTAMGEIIPGIGGYRGLAKYFELTSKANDAKTPELKEKYMKEAQECCKEGIVKCIPGGSLALSGAKLTLSTFKYVGNIIAKPFGYSFSFDINPLHWF